MNRKQIKTVVGNKFVGLMMIIGLTAIAVSGCTTATADQAEEMTAGAAVVEESGENHSEGGESHGAESGGEGSESSGGGEVGGEGHGAEGGESGEGSGG